VFRKTKLCPITWLIFYGKSTVKYGVFYYNPEYLPPKRKSSKKSVNEYQPPSGTSLAYEYACQRCAGGKELKIINLWEEKE
jgi:hypothetical protein